MGYEVDFLPVGEAEKSGDCIALRFGNLLYGKSSKQTVVVIDGGYRETGEKLVKHIKSCYQTNFIDLVVSTHPDDDHASGLEVILEEFDVGCLWMHQPWNHTDDIAKLFKDGRVTDNSVSELLRKSLETARGIERLAQSKNIPIIEPFSGLTDDSGCLSVLGPTETFYESLLPDFRGTPGPKHSLLEKITRGAEEFIHKIVESWDIETLDDSGETSAENDSSTILLLMVDGQALLFTADAGIPALTEIIDRLDKIGFDYSTLKFIQAPHHGSQRNIGPKILDRIVGPSQGKDLKLKTAFVSASKEGGPKHPSKKVTNAFRRRGAPVYATQGRTICLPNKAPSREGWYDFTPLPFYSEVEE